MNPLVVSYGGGVDSTAILIELHNRGMRPDAILFADTGGEKPETYDYLGVMNEWLASVGFPAIQVVKYHSPRAGDQSLEGECTRKSVLPGLAYGAHQCSIKWKINPQDRWLKSWPLAKEAWSRGDKVRKVIGYDAGPRDCKRAERSAKFVDPRFELWFPLIDWKITREEAEKIIEAAGLPVPVKSACFFCPAMKRPEVEHLAENHPELAARALEMERKAHARGLNTIKGLGRSWSWADHLARVLHL